MQSIAFSKYEGAGNDFILIDDRSLFFDKGLVPKLCDRKFGVGADGVILLQSPTSADFRMRIFNRDGTEAESCGNGLRCLGRFIADLGFSKKKYTIQTYDRLVELSYQDELIVVSMGEAKGLQLNLSTEQGIVHFADTGVPHAVHFLTDLKNASIDQLGPFFRHHPHFGAKGANANLAEMQLDGSIHVRTFERGVEGETLACGTGACAVAAIATQLHSLAGPIKIVFPGGVLQISRSGNQLVMAGPVNCIFTGQIRI